MGKACSGENSIVNSRPPFCPQETDLLSGERALIENEGLPEMNYLVSGASLGALAIATATPAMAQDAAPAAQERQGGVDVIIVTAQKRSEDLQDVPVSVSAIGEDALEELAKSIARRGVIQPIIVRPLERKGRRKNATAFRALPD